MFIKPATPATKIRDPHTKRHLPPEGREVPESTYWLRRLRDGSAVLAERDLFDFFEGQQSPAEGSEG